MKSNSLKQLLKDVRKAAGELLSTSSETPEKTYSMANSIKIIIEFCNNRKDIKEKLEPIIHFFSKAATKAALLKSNVLEEVSHLYPPPNIRSMQGQNKIDSFITHVFKITYDFSNLIAPTEKIDVSKKAHEFFDDLKELLNEFEALNLEAMINQYMPESLTQLKETILKKITNSMKEWFLKIESEIIKVENEIKIACIHSGTIEQFTLLSHPLKDSILLSMECALTLYQEFILLLDKLEVQLGFQEGALFKLFKQDNSAQEDKKDDLRLTDYSKSIILKIESLATQYSALIATREFIPIELPPYNYSKLEARKRLKNQIESDLVKKESEYANLTKNTRNGVTELLIKNQLYNNKTDLSAFTLVLPDKISKAAEATQIKDALNNDLKNLRKFLAPFKKKIQKSIKKNILSYHNTAISILKDIEFYLLEKERIEKIIINSPQTDTENPPRQFQPAETLKFLTAQFTKTIHIAKPYFHRDSSERKQLSHFKAEIIKAKNHAMNIFDPIFIEYTTQLFIEEKAAEKAAAELAELEKKNQQAVGSEIKLSAKTPEVKIVVENKAPQRIEKKLNPYTHFSHEYILIILRALDSINIVLELTAADNPKSQAKYPSAAIAEDITQINNIAIHVGQAFTACLNFSSYLKELVLREESLHNPILQIADENKFSEEDKHNSPNESNTVKPTEKRFITELQKKLTQRLDETISLFQFYLETVKDNWFGIDENIKPLVKNIAIDLKYIGGEIKNKAYSNYLSPPTALTHLSIAAENSTRLYKLIKNLDKLSDIASNKKITFPLEILYYINQAMKELFVLIDQIEIYFHLKQGVIFDTLKLVSYTNKKGQKLNIEFVIQKVQEMFAFLHYEFPPEEAYPYIDAINAARLVILQSESDESELVKKIVLSRDPRKAEQRVIQFPLTEQQLAIDLKSHNNEKLSNVTLQFLNYASSEHKSSETYMDDLDLIVLKNKDSNLLFEGKLAEDLKSENNKNEILTLLDKAITELKAKRHNWFVSKKSLEKRIISLDEFRRIVRKPGYTLADAAKELTDPKWKVLRRSNKILTDKLDSVEKQISSSTRRMNKLIRLPKLQSKHPIVQNDPLIARIEKRLAELKLSQGESFFRYASNSKKQMLLTELLKTIHENKISFKNALQRVKQNYPDDAYLLYDGKTGVMISDIESSASRSRIIKSAIMEQRLEYFSTDAKKPPMQEVAQNVQLLKLFKANPEMKLEQRQEQRLNKIAPGLLGVTF